MAEEIARDSDTARVENRDSRSGAGPEEVRIYWLSKGSAGPRRYNAVDRLIGERTAFRAGPNTVMLGRT